jgi:hypothetical protein
MTRKKLAPKQPQSTGKARRAAKNKPAGIPLDAMLREKLGAANTAAVKRLDQPVPHRPAPMTPERDAKAPVSRDLDAERRVLVRTGSMYDYGQGHGSDASLGYLISMLIDPMSNTEGDSLATAALRSLHDDLALLTCVADSDGLPDGALERVIYRLEQRACVALELDRRSREVSQ